MIPRWLDRLAARFRAWQERREYNPAYLESLERLDEPRTRVLRVLAVADEPLTGREIEERSGGRFFATVYPHTHRLELAGYVTSWTVEGGTWQTGGIPRRLYRITEKGRAALGEVEA